ncbi:hypothetical protein N7478_000491 [Penicillium angulare]|uniref:uncharacterized protein n=1 Tax=Penicillium angulare TaxID=116970 RepID=UPI002540D826|nr:uncharacterized protein N7478_000491 [Penicillium angulare]KAJ5291240.1 hypothetical protein N7478_000491 [Penicillium angulare]
MDLQGNPIPSGPRSTKVTTDPRAFQQPIEEPSGPVPNDSLAAESVRGGGAFSENRGAQPQGYSSQLKNPGSASETLPSAPVGGLREDRDAQQKYPEALGGQGNFPGTHISGYAGGPTATKKEMGINTGSQAPASGSSRYNAGQAPSYVADVTDGYQQIKPDGRNIREGGFSSNDAKNASFEAEIGSDQDPGRAAINKFQRTNAESGPDAGRPDQKTLNTNTPYDVLQTDQRA